MKAETSQIPGIDSQKRGLTNTGNRPVDALWSHIRRLKAQVESLELAASTARRDINRIDKKQYRDDSKSPPSQIPGNGQQEYHPALFG